MKLKVICLVLSLISADAHSIQFRWTVITAGTHFPEFTAAGLLDGEQYMYYDSNGRSITEDWLKKIAGADRLKNWIEDVKFHQTIVKKDLDLILEYFNKSEGIHTVQLLLGCEFDDDDTTRVHFFKCGYDGEDFFSLDGKVSKWTAANAKAKDFITKLNMVDYIQNNTDILKHLCIDWLMKCVSYGRETLERKGRVDDLLCYCAHFSHVTHRNTSNNPSLFLLRRPCSRSSPLLQSWCVMLQVSSPEE